VDHRVNLISRRKADLLSLKERAHRNVSFIQSVTGTQLNLASQDTILFQLTGTSASPASQDSQLHQLHRILSFLHLHRIPASQDTFFSSVTGTSALSSFTGHTALPGFTGFFVSNTQK